MYEQYMKEIPVSGRTGPSVLTSVMDGKFLGWDSMSIRYGLIDSCGLIPEETDKLHTHDYDQLMVFMSSDPKDMLNLNAELEFTFGTDNLRHRITVPTFISIPAGTPHFSPIVRNVDRKFLYMIVSFDGEFKANVTDENAKQGEGCGRWSSFRDESNKLIQPIAFSAHDAYHYGSDLKQDSGGVGFHINTHLAGFPLMFGWQSVCLPHFMGPIRDDGKHHPHAHADFDEALIFLSMDTDNLTDLHGELDISIGPEDGVQEHYVMNKSCITPLTTNVFHLPLEFTKANQPFVFMTLSRNPI